MAEPVTLSPAAARDRRNDRVLGLCVLLVIGMVGLSYAAVPLYRLFCQVTGFGGTTQRADAAPGAVPGALFTVRFDANVNGGLPWRFGPVERSVRIPAGEQTLAFYRAENRSARETVGTATFNVTPELAGRYFSKIACFCFEEQRLAAGAVVDMPVSFFVDPAILDDPDLAGVRTITLSYTFFPLAGTDTGLSAPVGAVSAARN